MRHAYFVRYPRPIDDNNGHPIIDGVMFRFPENARKHAAGVKGSKVRRVNADAYGLNANTFNGEPHPPAVRASGGKLARRIVRGVMTATRELHRKRRHGPPVSGGGLFMRPPGCGSVNYQDPKGKHTPRMYAGAPGPTRSCSKTTHRRR